MTSEQIRHRSDILNTQVITRDTGKRLGVVKQLLVDIDRREVVALGLRDNPISIAGIPRYMLLSSIRQMGDVILVEDEDVIEDIDVEAYSSLVNSEVITEAGDLLGKVRGFKFDSVSGKVFSLIIGSFGMPFIPEQLVSTYELPIEEIVSSGPDRLIVFEGAEERLQQLSVGVLERLGLGKAPWEREEEGGYYPPPVRVDNQLPAGVTTRPPVKAKPARTPKPLVETPWNEDESDEPEPEPIPQRRPEPVYYDEMEEETNWSEATTDRRDRYYRQPEEVYDDDEYEEEDVWEDAPEPEVYRAPRVNIPEKKRTPQPEYEVE